jgi:hypothetical protein
MRRRAVVRRLVAAGAVAAAAFVLPGRAAADDGLDPVAATAAVAIQAVGSDVASSPTISAATAQAAAAAQAAAEEPQQPSQDVVAGVDAAVSDAISLDGAATPSPEPPPPPLSAPAVDVQPAAEPVSAPPPGQIEGPSAPPAAVAVVSQAAAPPTAELTGPAVAEPRADAAPAQAPSPIELPVTDFVQAPPLPVASADPLPESSPPQVDDAPPTQYQDGDTGSINSSDTSASNSGLTWTWNWNWNCSDPTAGTSVISPSNASGDTWLWNWQWSCGADAAPPPPTCTGCNIAISIRVLSPGDDGDLMQSIVNTTESIASTVNDTVQQATQAIVQPPAVAPTLPVVPPALPSLPALLGLVEPASLGLTTAMLVPLALFPVGPELSLTLVGETTRADTGVIPAVRPRAEQRGGVAPVTPSSFLAPPTPLGAAEPATAAAAPPRARPTERRPHHGPLRLPREPFTPPAQLSVAPASSGTGSAGGVGLAILVGALLAASPSSARWLRTARERRHRAPVSRRPERPG